MEWFDNMATGDPYPPIGPTFTPTPKVEYVFDSIVVRDEFYHRTRFEDIVLSLIHGMALLPREGTKNAIATAIKLARLVEQELDSAQG